MVRAYLNDGHTVAQAAGHFGISRFALQGALYDWERKIKLGHLPSTDGAALLQFRKTSGARLAHDDDYDDETYEPTAEELAKIEELFKPKVQRPEVRQLKWRRG